MNWSELYFGPVRRLSSGFQGKNGRNDFQKIIFYFLKSNAFWKIPLIIFYLKIRQSRHLFENVQNKISILGIEKS